MRPELRPRLAYDKIGTAWENFGMAFDLSPAQYAVLDFLYDQLQLHHDVVSWDTTPAHNEPGERRIHDGLLANGYMAAVGNHQWDGFLANGFANLVRLTSTGVAFVFEIRKQRMLRTPRAWTIRDRLLNWYAGLSGGASAKPADFLSTDDAYFYGEPFTSIEAVNAGQYLAGQGLLEDMSAWGPNGAKFRINVRGRSMVDEGGLIAVYNANQPAVGDVTIRVDGHGNQINTGSYVQQVMTATTNTVTSGFEDIAKAMSELLRELPNLGMPATNRLMVEESANEVLVEVQKDAPRPMAIQKAFAVFQFALTALLSGPIGDMGSEAAARLLEMIQNLPIPGC